MLCRKCQEEMEMEIITDLPDPQERKFTCSCGQVARDGEFYDLIWEGEE